MSSRKTPAIIETFEVDGVIEVVSPQGIDVASTAWNRYAVARRSGTDMDKVTRGNSALGYISRGVYYEWRLYRLETL